MSNINWGALGLAVVAMCLLILSAALGGCDPRSDCSKYGGKFVTPYQVVTCDSTGCKEPVAVCVYGLPPQVEQQP